ncbi:MAG: alpha-N-acetylglucosaminidase [Opitutae bacterium]|nr:alpha-N-acetylglucosaminidase [Opitutae bacterium]
MTSGSVLLRAAKSVCALLAACLFTTAVRADSLDAARALVARIVPQHAKQIVLEPLEHAPGAPDAFEVETRDGRLVLRGHNGVTIGAALNWYFRNVAHAQISWCGDNLALPEKLPAVPEKVRIESPYAQRVYLNYCTFNYTAAWWDRARWEREIDWMALNGVTTPLAITGQEAVWQATLRRFGMNDDEIRAFFVGPAFFAWQWMTNIEAWGGPLPQSWIDSHFELGQWIIRRERELGMTPILQGFTGCVPVALAERFPSARILQKKVWCEIPPGPAQLDPADPLFERMGRAFLEEQQKLFGGDHLYAADPFHEGEPPQEGAQYLHDVGAKIFHLTTAFDPQATIVMQGWSIREGIVRGIPEDRLLVLDLTGQKWRETDSFWGRRWVAGIIQNYGGRHSLGGNLPQLATNAPSLLGTPAGRGLVGVGNFAEAIEHNPLLFDLAADLAWHRTAPDLAAWTQRYVHARYGTDNPAAQRAWSALRTSVYAQKSPEPPMESPLQARPALELKQASPWGSFVRDYDVEAVWRAWGDLLAAAPQLGRVDPFRYDLVDVARQALADLSLPLHREVVAAWRSGDRAKFIAARDRFLALGADLDRLLGTRREFLLGPWLADARAWGKTSAEADLYERNARQLITVWGGTPENDALFEYSCRQWSGLMEGFYLERWRKYFAWLEQQPAGFDDHALPRRDGRVLPAANDFYRDLARWEFAWCERHDPHPTTTRGDSVAVARALFEKWSPVRRASYAGFDWQNP